MSDKVEAAWEWPIFRGKPSASCAWYVFSVPQYLVAADPRVGRATGVLAFFGRQGRSAAADYIR